ncbi:MAG: hypothetical protein WC773_01075 [Patescibacteria group bacterium]
MSDEVRMGVHPDPEVQAAIVALEEALDATRHISRGHILTVNWGDRGGFVLAAGGLCLTRYQRVTSQSLGNRLHIAVTSLNNAILADRSATGRGAEVVIKLSSGQEYRSSNGVTCTG